MNSLDFLSKNLQNFWEFTGFANATPEHFVMLAVGLLFITLASIACTNRLRYFGG